jgi:hypothetical protein
VPYTTSWQTDVQTSQSTSGSASYTTTWTVTQWLRITADNAGGYKFTQVQSAKDYGESYLDDGEWVETT